MTIPTIHMNGDTQKTLYGQCSAALDAVRMAVKACREMHPNGRNYYPQGEGALGKAFEEYYHRIAHLTAVRDELEAMLEAIADGGHKPG